MAEKVRDFQIAILSSKEQPQSLNTISQIAPNLNNIFQLFFSSGLEGVCHYTLREKLFRILDVKFIFKIEHVIGIKRYTRLGQFLPILPPFDQTKCYLTAKSSLKPPILYLGKVKKNGKISNLIKR